MAERFQWARVAIKQDMTRMSRDKKGPETGFFCWTGTRRED